MATKDQNWETTTQQQDSSSTKAVETVEKGVKPFRAFMNKFQNDWSIYLSAALVYNLLLAPFPIFVALISILGLVLSTLAPGTTNTVFQGITRALPAGAHPENIIKGVHSTLVHSSGILGLIAVLSAIFFGSRLFVFLDNFFSIVYRVLPLSFLPHHLTTITILPSFLT